MTRHAVYRVTGRRNYRGHQPGQTFEAALDRAAEARAVARGDIQVVRRVTPAPPDGWTLPHGWPPPKPHSPLKTGAPKGALSLKEA